MRAVPVADGPLPATYDSGAPAAPSLPSAPAKPPTPSAPSIVDGVEEPVVMPDPIELSWPLAAPSRETSVVGAPLAADDEPELPSAGTGRTGIKVSLDPFEVTPRNDRPVPENDIAAGTAVAITGTP
jgi:hypothetical protein